MDISKKLKEKGWFLSDDGVEILIQYANSNDLNILTKKALEIDLKKIGNGSFISEISKTKNDYINGNVILQLSKLKNVAAPKIDQNSTRSPRLLKLTLTDGKESFCALEMKHIRGLSLNTPPGTKIYLKNCQLKLLHNYILLNPENTDVLGGKVASLYEKWEQEQKLANYARGTRARTGSSEFGCPPPWVPFDKNIIDSENIEHKVADVSKSIEPKAQNATAEFDMQRQENIKQALLANQNNPKKSFGGGKKKLVDVNVQKIMDKGFSQYEAENALKFSKQNVDRALKKLQFSTSQDQNTPRPGKFEKYKEPFHKNDQKEGKPSTGKISLSDFLEEKLLAKTNNEETKKSDQAFSLSRSNDIKENNVMVKPAYRKGNLNQNTLSESNKYEKKTQIKPTHDFNNFNNQSYDQRTKFENRNSTSNFNSHLVNRFERLEISNNFQNYKDTNQSQNKQKPYENKIRNKYEQSSNSYSDKIFNNKANHYQNFLPNHVNHLSESPKNECSTRIFHNKSNTSGNNSSRKYEPKERNWCVGDRCLAKYWEDQKFYDAEITGLSKNTCVVRFLEYGNFEEINKFDCLPVQNNNDSYHKKSYDNSYKPKAAKADKDHADASHSESHKSEDQDKQDMIRKTGNNFSSETQNRRNRPIRNIQSYYVPPAQRN